MRQPEYVLCMTMIIPKKHFSNAYYFVVIYIHNYMSPFFSSSYSSEYYHETLEFGMWPTFQFSEDSTNRIFCWKYDWSFAHWTIQWLVSLNQFLYYSYIFRFFKISLARPLFKILIKAPLLPCCVYIIIYKSQNTQ